jgi:hypothetical protein
MIDWHGEITDKLLSQCGKIHLQVHKNYQSRSYTQIIFSQDHPQNAFARTSKLTKNDTNSFVTKMINLQGEITDKLFSQ